LEYNKLIVKIKYNLKYVIYLYGSENVFMMAERWAEISLRSIKLAGIAHANGTDETRKSPVARSDTEHPSGKISDTAAASR
jgi:hypothetical protein